MNSQAIAAPPAPPPLRSHPAPLRPTLAIVFLCSLGTGGVMNGVFFVARERFAFSEFRNLLLGLCIGAVYIVGAVGVSRALRWLDARSERITTRGVLTGLMLSHGVLCLVPWLAQAEWSLWAFAAIYSMLSGALWPIVESFLSGGRRARGLRHVVGAFNLTWASAVAAAFWGMSLLIRQAPLGAIAALGAAHFTCIVLARLLPAQPAQHLDDTHEPHPPVYRDLLICFRWLLVLSYVLVCAVGPVMPTKLAAVGLEADAATRIASAWTISRLFIFLLMQVWHGWHGRWRTVGWSAAALLSGFAVALLSHSATGVIIGLSLFGIGLGGIYCAALYYAMEVGGAQVEAGGTHEALIGAGYTIGPLLGVIAWSAAYGGLIEPDIRQVHPLMLALAALTTAAAVAAVIASMRRAHRSRRSA